jgi:hypothetical protein
MNPGVALITLTRLDSASFLPLSREILGYSPAKSADSVCLSNIVHHLVCLASFKDENVASTVQAASLCLDLLHAGFLIAIDDRDTVELVQIASLPFISTDTLTRGIDAIILSGSLAQWCDAVRRGCREDVSRDVRYAFNSVYRALCQVGLKDMFDNRQAPVRQDQTFLLENR